MKGDQLERHEAPDEENLTALQDRIFEWTEKIRQYPPIQGVELEDVALNNAANTTIKHKLGRVPEGYQIFKSTAAATIHWVSWDGEDIVLFASAATTVKLWVF